MLMVSVDLTIAHRALSLRFLGQIKSKKKMLLIEYKVNEH